MQPSPHSPAPASDPGPAAVGTPQTARTAPAASGRHEVTLRFLAAPTDQGHSGTVDAGRVLEWVDKAAFAAATAWSGSYCVTAYVGNIHFRYPVEVGEMVEVTGTVLHTGSTSMHINMVARNEDGDAVPVPAWEPVSEEDRTLWRHARDLLEIRGRAPGNRLPNHLLDPQEHDAGPAGSSEGSA